MRSEDDIRTLSRLLDWYQAMGVETATASETTNWLNRGEQAPGYGFRWPGADAVEPAEPAQRQNAPRPGPDGRAPLLTPRGPLPSAPRQFTSTSPDAAELSARHAARSAKSLDELESALRTFEGCGLKATAKNLCFYRGSPQARLMVIGEAPGRDEDLAGKPFVGRAGQLLDRMLASIGLSEADVHITNIVYWRPPGNRTPTPQEGHVCRPFLERQIELVAPEIVLLLGGAAAKHILATPEGIMRIRGKWREIQLGNHHVQALATLHPAYLLRTPAAKRLAWRDLLSVRAALGA